MASVGAWALARACHPAPTLAVTAVSAGLAALAGLHLGTAIILTLAVASGQLSIGWSNDQIDAVRDRAVQRTDKPIAAGEIAPAVVYTAIGCALAATIALSLALGYRAGLIALLTVACGWAYNLGLKATVLSWATFAFAFGLLPAIATLSRPTPRWPAWWAIAAGALFGVAAHFANVLPDLRDDAVTGIRGLPHRLGARPSTIIVPVLLVGASAAILLAGSTDRTGWRVAVLGGCCALAIAAAVAGLARPSSRLFFASTVAIAIVDVVLFGLSGGRLV